MKFGKFMRRNMSSDKKQPYIPYKQLKKRINIILAAKQSSERELLEKDFEDYLIFNVGNVNTFYQQQKRSIETRHDVFSKNFASLKSADINEKTKEHLEMLHQRMKQLHNEVSDLKMYCSLNVSAAQKILKKHDKLTNLNLTLVLRPKIDELDYVNHVEVLNSQSKKTAELIQTVEKFMLDHNCTFEPMFPEAADSKFLKLFRIIRNTCIAVLALAIAYFVTQNLLLSIVQNFPVTFASTLLASVAFIIMVNKEVKKRKADIPEVYIPITPSTLFLLLPTNIISRIWGKVHAVPLPMWARTPLYMLWTVVFRCNIDEMRYPMNSYSCLGEFFSRPLKDGARTICSGKNNLASPVDGKVVSVGEAAGDRLHQIKGISYSLNTFLGVDQVSPKPGKKLFQCVIYLAPGDYHRIHSPADWKINQRKHVPGALLPVNPIAVKFVPGLFAMNERVVLQGEWKRDRFFSLTAVGALNVGSVALNFDREVETNNSFKLRYPTPKMMKQDEPYGAGSSYDRTYPNGIAVEKGEEIAMFKLGSTVVLVIEAEESFTWNIKPGQKLRLGEMIGQE